MAPAVRGRAGGFATCRACVGQWLEDLNVEIEELLNRAPAQLLASAEACNHLEHVRLTQWEAEREGPARTRRGGVGGGHAPFKRWLSPRLSPGVDSKGPVGGEALGRRTLAQAART
eukprot:scaffold105497_cov60-Phaeocystis_antarctica.AAC.2